MIFVVSLFEPITAAGVNNKQTNVTKIIMDMVCLSFFISDSTFSEIVMRKANFSYI